jgi:hypothetical protein
MKVIESAEASSTIDMLILQIANVTIPRLTFTLPGRGRRDCVEAKRRTTPCPANNDGTL